MSSTLRPGDRVVLHRPRELDGTIGEVLGAADGGVEVQFTGGGTPMSVVVASRRLTKIGDAPARQRVGVPEPARGPAPAVRPVHDRRG